MSSAEIFTQSAKDYGFNTFHTTQMKNISDPTKLSLTHWDDFNELLEHILVK